MARADVHETIEHPNQDRYPGQKIATVIIDESAYLDPYIQNSDEIFLKTIIPRRKATSKFVRSIK
jgi:hypothetical protein